ncbi:MAG TPA: catalase, partial [Rummeliibacillus sp.]|nr:catalase [Rummeliibacillus sp.]
MEENVSGPLDRLKVQNDSISKKSLNQNTMSQTQADFISEQGPSHLQEDRKATYHSQTVGDRGPVLEQDSILHETLEDFVHTKIIERPVHVKGYGAFGYFQTEHSMKEYTKLSFLQNPGIQVPVTVRFSLAVSTKGTPDTSRNVVGFSTKFYTDEGVFDLLCNHIPVFSIRDAMRFPEFIKANSPSPVNNL